MDPYHRHHLHFTITIERLPAYFGFSHCAGSAIKYVQALKKASSLTEATWSLELNFYKVQQISPLVRLTLPCPAKQLVSLSMTALSKAKRIWVVWWPIAT